MLVADTVVMIRPRASSAPSRLGRVAMEIRLLKLDRPSPTAEQLTELHERLSELVRQLPAGFTVKQAASTAQGRKILLAWRRKYRHPAYEPWRRPRTTRRRDRPEPR